MQLRFPFCRVGRTCGYHGLVLDSYRPLCKDGFLGGDTEAGGGLEQGPVIRSGLDSLRAVVEMHLSSGGQTKEETRIQARAAGLVTQDSPESQEICFIPDDDYRRFLQSRLGKSPGRIVNTSGRVLGRHTGIYNFTLGQRRGLGVSVSEPLYVVELRPDECDVVVGSAEEALIWTVRVDGLVQHVDELPEHGYTQLSSTGGAVGVRIEKDGEEMLLHLEEAVRGVAPGQAAVVYVDDVVVAAGAISSVSG